MKFIALFLIIAISVQPVQAGGCGMETGQASSHQMQNMPSDDHDAHKCCDPGQAQTRQDCGGEMLCGFCNIPPSTVHVPHLGPVVWTYTQSLNSEPGTLSPSHSSPLYRPPIS